MTASLDHPARSVLTDARSGGAYRSDRFRLDELLTDADFDDADGQIEVIFAGDLTQVPPAGPAPVAGLELRRVLGELGTSFEAWIEGQCVGVFQVEDAYGTANAQLARWADEGDHWVAPQWRGRGIGIWLFRHGCAWLRLGGKDRILTYAVERRAKGMEPVEADVERCESYYARYGVTRLTRTRRGWSRSPG